jgi:hypothetical protein
MRALKLYVAAKTDDAARYRAACGRGYFGVALVNAKDNEHIYEVTITSRRYRPRAKRKGAK